MKTDIWLEGAILALLFLRGVGVVGHKKSPKVVDNDTTTTNEKMVSYLLFVPPCRYVQS